MLSLYWEPLFPVRTSGQWKADCGLNAALGWRRGSGKALWSLWRLAWRGGVFRNSDDRPADVMSRWRHTSPMGPCRQISGAECDHTSAAGDGWIQEESEDVVARRPRALPDVHRATRMEWAGDRLNEEWMDEVHPLSAWVVKEINNSSLLFHNMWPK